MVPYLDHYFTNNNDLPIRRISISSPADANATIKIYANAVRQVQDDPPGWMYQAASGELLATQHTELSAAENLYGGMIALHTGRFAEPLLRWLYFLCGLAGCAMIATGAVMWAKRLRQKSKATGKGPFGLRLVEALNLATIMGLPAATAAFFHANRLLPIDLIGRADKEVLAFFITWSAFTLAAFVSLAALLVVCCTEQCPIMGHITSGEYACNIWQHPKLSLPATVASVCC